MSQSVVVYTLPSCVQCDTTKRMLKKNDIAFEEVDLTKDSKAMEMVQGLGYTSAPVVFHGSDHWSGFRIEKLKALIA